MAGEADSRQSHSLSIGDIKAALQIRKEAKKSRRREILPAQTGSEGRWPLSTHKMAALQQSVGASRISSWIKAAVAYLPSCRPPQGSVISTSSQ